MKNVAELINVVVHSLAFAAAFGAVIATTCIADATEIRRDAQGRVLGTARADSTGRITCRDSQGRQKRPSTTDSNPKWRQGDFAGKLYRQLVEGDGNLAFSPYGVASVCALLGIGAKGETADAFRNALELSTNKPDEVARIFREAKQDLCNAVEISDSVWLFQGFRPCDEYRTRAANGFGAEARNTSYGDAAMREINAYVSDKTHGKIPRLLQEPPEPLTRMVAVNTVYLKAKWEHGFTDESYDREFTTLSGKSITVPFMHDYEKRAMYYKTKGLAVLALPYRDCGLEMMFLLPDKHVTLSRIEALLSRSFIGEILRALTYNKVVVALPKFEFEMRHNLVKPLCGIGLGIAFDQDRADFSGIAGTNLSLSEAEQVVKIKVDEDGTEAAAATYAKVVRGCASFGPKPPPPPEFVADRPFIFLIRDRRSDAILFMGRVTNPAKK